MFEDCLIESKSAPISTAKQWTTAGSIAFQTSAAAVIAILPLLHPERLPSRNEPPRVLAPLPPKPIIHIQPVAATSSAAPSPTALPTTQRTISLISLLNGRQSANSDGPIGPIIAGNSMADGSGLPGPLTSVGLGTNVSIAPVHPATRPNISGGVATGLLLTPIRPIYPAIARAAHIEGAVVVEAVISRSGTIEGIHVISGPAMLRQAAIDAIQVARYRPFRLNGEPTEVQTTITVNFRIGA